MTTEIAPERQSPPPTLSSEPDWTDSVTELVVDLVDATRDRTTGPILKVARIAVYGLVVSFVLLVVAVIGVVVIGRSLSLIPIDIWISYLAIGSLMIALGLLLWSRRQAAS